LETIAQKFALSTFPVLSLWCTGKFEMKRSFPSRIHLSSPASAQNNPSPSNKDADKDLRIRVLREKLNTGSGQPGDTVRLGISLGWDSAPNPTSRAVIPVLENCVGFSHNSGPHAGGPIMSLRGAERSNLDFGRLEIASGFALAMTIFQPFRVIKTGITFENPSIMSRNVHSLNGHADTGA